MDYDHQRDFVVRGKYAYQHHRIDPRIRHNDFEYPRVQDFRQRKSSYNRYQFSPAEFYNSIQREGRAYDLAANYRRQEVSHEERPRNQRSFKTEFRATANRPRHDDLIMDDVHVRLTDHPYLDATEIIVGVKHGVVTLSGYVASRTSKRLAEDICDQVRGVVQIENLLRIQPMLARK